jgi:hypothetical protein
MSSLSTDLSTEFVYALSPAAENTPYKKCLLYQRLRNSPFTIAEAENRETIRILREILTQSKAQLIIDVATFGGRELLHRLIEEPPYLLNRRRYRKRLFLCSLIAQLQERIQIINKTRPTEYHVGEYYIVPMLERFPRSFGGIRPYINDDAIVARIAVKSKKENTEPEFIKDLYFHPLSLVPKFFIQEAGNIPQAGVYYDAKQTEQMIVDLSACFCKLRQYPFPIASEFEDSFCVLQPTPPIRRALMKKYPYQCRAVLLADQLLLQLGISASRIFHKKVILNGRDAVVKSFLQLIAESWVGSFVRQVPVDRLACRNDADTYTFSPDLLQPDAYDRLNKFIYESC